MRRRPSHFPTANHSASLRARCTWQATSSSQLDGLSAQQMALQGAAQPAFQFSAPRLGSGGGRAPSISQPQAGFGLDSLADVFRASSVPNFGECSSQHCTSVASSTASRSTHDYFSMQPVHCNSLHPSWARIMGEWR